MDEKILEKAGLSYGEAKIYLALLSLGQSSTGPIVTKSGISTSKTYKILKRMESKGIVGHIVKNKTIYWSPANPKKILNLIEEKEKEIKNNKKEIEKIIPKLVKKINNLKEKQHAEVYIGLDGMKTVFNEETEWLNKNKEINYVIGVGKEYPKSIYNFFDILENKKDAMKIKRKFLFSEEARGTMPFIEKSKYCKVRYIPYGSIVSINIYGKVSFISIFSEEPIFFVIESKEITESFKNYFNILWKNSNK